MTKTKRYNKEKETKKQGSGITQKKIETFIKKAQARGFVTYSEILQVLPKIEKDVSALEKFYENLEKEGISVEENKESLEVKKTSKRKLKADLQMYLKEIAKVPFLAAEEEKELAKRIERGDEEARKKLIQANLKLVVKIAKWYKHKTKNLTLFNLILNGSLGLGKAVSLFKWQSKYNFSTLAILLIRKCILDVIEVEKRYLFKKQLREIPFPVHIVGEIAADLGIFRRFNQREIEEKVKEKRKLLRSNLKKDIKRNIPEIIELLSKLTLVSKLKAKEEIRKFIKNF